MKIAIYGYGNLGKGVEKAVSQNPDMTLFGVFTRRKPDAIQTETGCGVFSSDDILKYREDIDVLIIAGGSATDLPVMTPSLARDFNVVDSFDTHANIDAHFTNVDSAAREGRHTALISCGWDPGMFSLARLYGESILPEGRSETFWGRGVSQGHSDAIRRIDGVLDARQYTVPVEETVRLVREGVSQDFTAREKHTRECFVVAEPDADTERIAREIREMPNYFADYDTTVHFISEEELKKNHAGLPHGGFVIRTGSTGLSGENRASVEYSLQLDSNPEFTASVLLSFARAVYRMYGRSDFGCKTVFDIAPKDISPKSPEELRKSLL